MPEKFDWDDVYHEGVSAGREAQKQFVIYRLDAALVELYKNESIDDFVRIIEDYVAFLRKELDDA